MAHALALGAPLVVVALGLAFRRRPLVTPAVVFAATADRGRGSRRCVRHCRRPERHRSRRARADGNRRVRECRLRASGSRSSSALLAARLARRRCRVSPSSTRLRSRRSTRCCTATATANGSTRSPPAAPRSGATAFSPTPTTRRLSCSAAAAPAGFSDRQGEPFALALLFGRIDAPFVAVPDPQSNAGANDRLDKAFPTLLSRRRTGLSRHIPKQYLAFICQIERMHCAED